MAIPPWAQPSLEAPHLSFAWMLSSPPLCCSPCSARVSVPEEGVFGAGAHTDWGMLTLLRTTGPGLQILPDRQSGDWVDVPPVEGAFVVNLGDMLQLCAFFPFPLPSCPVLRTVFLTAASLISHSRQFCMWRRP